VSNSDFGELITAMVTPFTATRALDLDAAQRLAVRLTAYGRNDSVVVNGTTGESATTSDREKATLVKAVVSAVAGHAQVIAGVGASGTERSIELAVAAEAAGAHALLLVAPYYLRPSQEGLLHHFLAVADRTSLPVMLYDVPKRTGVAIDPDTLVRAAEHPRIQAVKDANGDLEAASWVMRRTPLAYYSGDDPLNLPWLSIGATGFVSVAGHVVIAELRQMLSAYRAGRVVEAARIHRQLLPVYRGLFRGPATVLTKAALSLLGEPIGPVRPPLLDATVSECNRLALDLADAGVRLPAVRAASMANG
jgi:4-hydroxy-tetrahydrodipicolinate synthase